MYYVTISFLGLGNKPRVTVDARKTRATALAWVTEVNSKNDGRTARYAGTMKPQVK